MPDRDRSRAVVVDGVGDGDPWGLTRSLAEALSCAGAGQAFHPWCVQIVEQAPPADVLDAVGRAAREASDVLLLYYRGPGAAPDAGLDLGPVAELMSRSPAVRPVVILDDREGTARSCFSRESLPWYDIRHPVSVTLFTPESGSAHERRDDSFTRVLVRALTAGIGDGPEVPELADIRTAIDAQYLDWAQSATTESHSPPRERVILRRGYKTPKLALSVNPSAAAPHRPDALPANDDVVLDEYWQ